MTRWVGPVALVFLGLTPIVLSGLMMRLGWWPDAMVISSTLHPEDPWGGAIRGCLVAATALVSRSLSPILLGGGLGWGMFGLLDGARVLWSGPVRRSRAPSLRDDGSSDKQ